MKIALLTSGIFPFQIGGIQKHSYFLAKGLAERRVYVDVFQTSKVDSNSLKEYYTEAELKYLNFFFIAFPNPAPLPGHYIYASYLFSKRLYEKVKGRKKYDAIYAQGFTAWYFLKKKAFQENLITNLHGLEMFQASINVKQRLGQLFLRIPAYTIIKKSAKQVSLGGKLTAILHKVGAKENSVVEIPNAIPTSWITESQEFEKLNRGKQLQLVFIGRYERRKGIEELQQVICKTTDKLQYHIIFIGPIPQEKRISKAGVNYLGLVKDMDKIKSILEQSDVLVCPSYSEGMPTVILEAMACGCAIIATDVGAVKTMVSKDNGWLISGDIKSGLQKAIGEALELNEDELLKMKITSIQKVSSQFTWQTVIEKTIAKMEYIKSV